MRSKWFWAVLALVAVLGITTAASATTRGLITGKQIAPHSINSKKLVNHTIQRHDLSRGLVKSLQGARGPQGEPGVSGHTILTATHQLLPDHEMTVTVTSPVGQTVLGGGVSSKTSGALIVEESYPSGPSTWTVTVYAWPNVDAPSTPIDFTAYAIVATVT